jgi:perosamine synthetase
VIPHNQPCLSSDEKQAAERVLSRGWLVQGTEVETFENEMCGYLGLPMGHAVAMSSGTAALFVALRCLGARGATVACPVYACSALVNAITFAGAEPRFVDTTADSPNADAAALMRTGARFAVVPHMFGQPIDIAAIDGMIVVEDCAQALGARIHGHPVGLQGDVGIYSFNATKMITSGGQGGMVVSRDRKLVDDMRDFREFDCRRDRKPRFNFQMTDLQAAVGREQLKKLPAFLQRRADIFEQYRSAGFDLVGNNSGGAAVRFRTVLRVSNPRTLIEHLARHDIGAIVPVEEWELLSGPDGFHNAATFSRTTVSLPTYPFLRNEDVARIIDVVANGLDQGRVGIGGIGH